MTAGIQSLGFGSAAGLCHPLSFKDAGSTPSAQHANVTRQCNSIAEVESMAMHSLTVRDIVCVLALMIPPEKTRYLD